MRALGILHHGETFYARLGRMSCLVEIVFSDNEVLLRPQNQKTTFNSCSALLNYLNNDKKVQDPWAKLYRTTDELSRSIKARRDKYQRKMDRMVHKLIRDQVHSAWDIEQHWTASSATAEIIFIVCYDDNEQPPIEGALRHYVRLRFRTRKHSQLDYYPGHQVNAGNDVSHVLGYCMDSIAV